LIMLGCDRRPKIVASLMYDSTLIAYIVNNISVILMATSSLFLLSPRQTVPKPPLPIVTFYIVYPSICLIYLSWSCTSYSLSVMFFYSSLSS
jgi:hypothetical protein